LIDFDQPVDKFDSWEAGVTGRSGALAPLT
jgi:hypothetical protein